MALSLEQLTAAFKKNDSNDNRPSNYYRFWDMQPGQQAVIRFLPDKNTDNPLAFTVEKMMHELTINGEKRTIPCMKRNPGDNCPVCNVSQAYYKEEGKGSVNGKKYWRNKQNIVQVLVIEDPLPVNPETDLNSEGKVMFINLGYQVMAVVKEGLGSGELDRNPTLFEGGCDFIIKKTMLGDKPKYDVGSKFARRATDLTEDEIAIVEADTVDLSTLLPPLLDIEKVEQMLEADLTGNAYGNDDNAQANAEPAHGAAAAVAADLAPVTDAKQDKAPEFDATKKSVDILAQIRERKEANAE